MLANLSKTLFYRPLHQLTVGIIFFAAMIIAGAWYSVETLIEREREQAITDVKRENTNLARTFEEHTIRTLDGIDEILQILKREYEAEGQGFNLPGLWTRLPINPAILRNAVITDSSGMVILGSSALPSASLSLADRDHINTHFATDSGQMFISKPVEARINGQWSIIVTRRANRPDGSLMGVVNLAVNPFYFSDFYKDIDIGRAGLICLIGTDGILRARLYDGPIDLTLDVSRSEMFRQAALGPHGSYIANSLTDGIARIFSYRTVRNYPLFVSVGVALDDALSDAAAGARIYRIFLTLACFAILLFAGILIAVTARARRHSLASERTAAAMALAKTAAETAGQQLRDIADNLPVFIAYYDSDRRIRFINKTGELWLAMPTKDIVGKTYAELSQTESSTNTDDLSKQLMNGPLHKENTMKFPDGISRVTSTILLPDKGPDGRLHGYYRLSTDITERKRLDEQLHESQKMDAIGQLTGGIAHDFNNLLMVISGNLELASESKDLPPKISRFIDTAKRGSQRGADLTRQLLSFSRRQSLSPTLTDLNTQVCDITKLLRRTIPESITIAVQTHASPVTTMIDAGQFENALLNLALNARDAMKQGGLLTFSTNIAELRADETAGADVIPAGRYAMIELRDNGAGMTPEVMARACEPFFTTKPMGEGTGLGLSMVYGFVRQSGGYVQLSSHAGRGTTVRLLFPQAEPAVSQSPAIDTALNNPPLNLPSSGNRRRILVVEDMNDVLTTVTGMLDHFGFDTVTASDGPSALQTLAQSELIDGMLTDIGLPGGLSGLELADIAAEKWPNLKIATMSGYKEEYQTDGEAMQNWQAVHLTKPFSRADLTAAMTTLFASETDDSRHGHRSASVHGEQMQVVA